MKNVDSKSVSSSDSKKETTIKAPSKRQPLTIATSNNNNMINFISESGNVTNLSDQDMCFCGKHISLIETSKDPYFHCVHCEKKYHTTCMKRNSEAKSCSFCHLRRLLPNREVKTTIFVGLLGKGKRKH